MLSFLYNNHKVMKFIYLFVCYIKFDLILLTQLICSTIDMDKNQQSYSISNLNIHAYLKLSQRFLSHNNVCMYGIIWFSKYEEDFQGNDSENICTY